MGHRQVQARYAFQDIKKGELFEYDPLVHDAVANLVDAGYLVHTGHDRDDEEATQVPVYVEPVDDVVESDPLNLEGDPTANPKRTKKV